MREVHTIGLDLAKHVFQVHGAKPTGEVVFRKKLRRHNVLAFLSGLPSCTVAMEACAGAHYWGREIQQLGHDVKLISPSYVKPFVKRQKNDPADAEAICEAAQRPTMRFVPVKSAETQASAMLFRTRDLLVRQRTQAINAMRGHLAEFGVIVPRGRQHASKLVSAVAEEVSNLPPEARLALRVLSEELGSLDRRIAQLDAEIVRRTKENESARRLMTIPGVGAVTASAITALMPPPASFQRGRDFRRLGGIDSASALEWRQEPARPNVEDGRANAAPSADHWRQRGCAMEHPERSPFRVLALTDAAPEAAHAGASGIGKQDGAHGLGVARHGRDLPSSGHGRIGREREAADGERRS